MSTALSIIIGILIFCAIVIIHEGGHYFAAKMCGVPVSEFSIGMGPVLFSRQTITASGNRLFGRE